MSEPITKACDNPVCINGHMYWENNSGVTTLQGKCPDCSGTGRVPDAEATLRAKLDAAEARIAALEAEKLRMYDEHARLVRVGNEEAHKNAAWWRGQVDAVTAQRDELREAADDVMRAAPAPTDLRLLLIGSDATPDRNSDLFNQADKYEVARQRLRAAVDGAR